MAGRRAQYVRLKLAYGAEPLPRERRGVASRRRQLSTGSERMQGRERGNRKRVRRYELQGQTNRCD